MEKSKEVETLPGFYLDFDHQLAEDDSAIVVSKPEKKKKIKKPYVPGSQYTKATTLLKELTEKVK